jgi:hypothetical protein
LGVIESRIAFGHAVLLDTALGSLALGRSSNSTAR